MKNFLHCFMLVAASFALAAIGICAVQVAHLAQGTMRHVDATVTDLDRTVQIAGGAINEARRIERDNAANLGAVNEATLATLRHADDLIVSLDKTQQQAGASISNTSAALVPVMGQTREDLAQVQKLLADMEPMVQHSTGIAGNLEASTADVQHEIHKLVYPPPRKWYQKYFLDPLKTAAHLVTIPLW